MQKTPGSPAGRPSATQKKLRGWFLVDFLDLRELSTEIIPKKQDANHGDWNMFSPDLPEIDG